MSYAPTSNGLLAPIQPILDDNQVSEILINQPGEVFVEKQGLLSNIVVPELTLQHLYMLFRLIANENEQEISENKPLLSGSLLDGSRVQCVLPPTSRYPTLSIRRKTLTSFSLEDYQSSNFYHAAKGVSLSEASFESLPEKDKLLTRYYLNSQWDKFIKQAIRAKKNIVISGGTSSGKTTFLNACLHHIPFDERILLLEDVLELDIEHPNKVQLLASKGDQGVARITMQDLVQCCLRLRPDRIIMGEIRGKEIMDFVAACSTGHEGSITSIHANNPNVAFMRMMQMYKLNNVPSMSDEDILRELKAVVDIIIQLKKTPQGRQVTEVYYRYADIADKLPVKNRTNMRMSNNLMCIN